MRMLVMVTTVVMRTMRAVRTVRAVGTMRAVRAVGAVGTMRAVRAVGAMGAVRRVGRPPDRQHGADEERDVLHRDRACSGITAQREGT